MQTAVHLTQVRNTLQSIYFEMYYFHQLFFIATMKRKKLGE